MNFGGVLIFVDGERSPEDSLQEADRRVGRAVRRGWCGKTSRSPSSALSLPFFFGGRVALLK